MSQVHPSQVIDGGDVIVRIASLPVPNRVTAVRNTTTGILTFTNRPAVGTASGDLIEMAGSSEFNTTFGKTNRTYRLHNDDGWEQDKITGRNWQATMSGLFVRAISTTPDLEASFKIIFENALSKEDEVYIEFLKYLGTIPAVTTPTPAPARKRYQVEGGTCKVISFGDQAPADNILQVNATLKGQSAFIYGFLEEPV
jgi:hypothetical protein